MLIGPPGSRTSLCTEWVRTAAPSLHPVDFHRLQAHPLDAWRTLRARAQRELDTARFVADFRDLALFARPSSTSWLRCRVRCRAGSAVVPAR